MNEGASSARRRLALRALAGSALFAASLALSLTDGIELADEAWFLRVGQRMLDGDLLYRDVAFGVTPLSAWILAASLAVCGVQVVVVKALVSACFATGALVTLLASRRTGLSPGSTAIAGAALVCLGAPHPQALYTPMAGALLLLAWQLSTRPGAHSTRRGVAFAGAVAGLCALAKQNIGLLALGALLATLAATLPKRDLPRAALVAVSAFAAPIGLTVLALAMQGSLPSFIDYCFIGKGTYARLAPITWLDGLAALFDSVAAARAGDVASIIRQHLMYALAAIALPALAIRVVVDRARSSIAPPVPLLSFVTAGFAAQWPRFDYLHVEHTMPWAIIALVYALRGLGSGKRGRALLASLGVATAVALGILASDRLGRLRDPAWQLSRLEHFRGSLVRAEEDALLRRQAAELARALHATPALLLTSRAGLFYLESGIRNPTPFDYPYVTTLGRNGDARLRDDLRDGRIAAVCLGNEMPRRFAPPLTSSFVASRMVRRGRAGPCTLYTLPGGVE